MGVTLQELINVRCLQLLGNKNPIKLKGSSRRFCVLIVISCTHYGQTDTSLKTRVIELKRVVSILNIFSKMAKHVGNTIIKYRF